ncbi:putative 2-hydroxyacid dehydrogenase HI_1556 [Rubritalea halochordaticola]|uniref:2-hydroxyacid dehydrogenase HI_1556 n=1 Tax=Rubritalea halochordaticola TaxID=714537 RepID=A0ABP9UXP1_9BACT
MNITFLDSSTLHHENDLDLSPLKQFGDLTLYETSSIEEIATRIADAEIVITNKAVLNKELIEGAKNLKLILSAATGVNQIDLEAAKAHDITVCNVAGYSTPSVAQHVFTFLLNFATSIPELDAEKQQWPQSPIFTRLDYPAFDLQGKTLGIIGLGAIGKEVAKIAQVFGMKVQALNSSNSVTPSGEIPRVDMETLLKTSDVISLHCPLTEETKHLINRESLSKMKPTAFLINTGRGPLINEPDLAEALDKGIIAGAGLDVLNPVVLPPYTYPN